MPSLNETIERLGKSGELRFGNVDELRAMPHFDKFVHTTAAHYRWMQPEHMDDLLALVANAFQAGINVGYEFCRVEVPDSGAEGEGSRGCRNGMGSVWLTEWKRKGGKVWTLDRYWCDTREQAETILRKPGMPDVEERIVEYRRVEPAPGDSGAGEGKP